MGRESFEEGELSTPLVAKEEHHQVYASGDHLGGANTTGCDDGGESRVDLPQPQVWLCLALWLLSLVPMFLAQFLKSHNVFNATRPL
ncbi:hypothetical protein SO802_013367 [Lithocarpus litseifolius]|uniref:Uncharacterized protein n=1 Tax=Lithocarpus litseifolius TaxID=425828 RepID=A0AAW2D9H9_9ROSI